MIDEVKLIDCLKQSGMIADNGYGNAMVDFIESQPKIDKWIPCAERLPEKDGFYLATIDGEIAGEDRPFSGLAEFENGKWVDDEEDYQCIIAWQPLLKPYEEYMEKEDGISDTGKVWILVDYILNRIPCCPFEDDCGIDFEKECVGLGEVGCGECIIRNIGKLEA